MTRNSSHLQHVEQITISTSYFAHLYAYLHKR